MSTFAPKRGGVWVWDENSHDVAYQSKDVVQKMSSKISAVSTGHTSVAAKKSLDPSTFNTMDIYTQAKFKKLYQRKVKNSDEAVATIQDIKDVAIFTTKRENLFPEFITYFHTVSVDKFLRSMLVYFQYYLQVWNKMQLRRIEATRKLRQPIVTVLENEVRDNLADLRSMVARDYAAILMGIGDAKKFHHMNNKNNDSLSERDRRVFETLISMTVKVVWVGLFRKNYALIDREVNRLMRTENYSPTEHVTAKSTVESITEEKRILLGKAYKSEKKLLHRSPAIQEITFDDHDHRLLSIGVNDIPLADERVRFLEIAYAAPEELLETSGVSLGVLGVRRKYLDPLLKPKDISTTGKRTSVLKVGMFNLPPKSYNRDPIHTKTLSSKPCQYQETQTRKKEREAQCKMWRNYLELSGLHPSELPDSESIQTRTSAAHSSVLSQT